MVKRFGSNRRKHRDAGAARVIGSADLFAHSQTRFRISHGRSMSVDALFGELLFITHLSGDAGVVDTRQPQRGIALHAVPADHDVFERGSKGMAKMQFAGNVGGRHDDDERLLAGSIFGEKYPCSIQNSYHFFSTFAGS